MGGPGRGSAPQQRRAWNTDSLLLPLFARGHAARVSHTFATFRACRLMFGSSVASELPEHLCDVMSASASNSNSAEDAVMVSGEDAATAPKKPERSTRAVRAVTAAARSERNRAQAPSEAAASKSTVHRLTSLPAQPGAQSLTEDEVLLLLREADVNTRMMKALGMITQLPNTFNGANGVKYAAAALALLAGRFNRPAGAAKQYNWRAAMGAFGVNGKVEPKNGEVWLLRLQKLDRQLVSRADAEALKQSATNWMDDRDERRQQGAGYYPTVARKIAQMDETQRANYKPGIAPTDMLGQTRTGRLTRNRPVNPESKRQVALREAPARREKRARKLKRKQEMDAAWAGYHRHRQQVPQWALDQEAEKKKARIQMDEFWETKGKYMPCFQHLTSRKEAGTEPTANTLPPPSLPLPSPQP